ncbi:mucin-2-like isoform X2 [Homarus americanus]|nr:mucin-2-like isoform X2 [Homarus americanus]XP_042229277.1 mucin-2-like isoform X2 [Homarus americanus]
MSRSNPPSTFKLILEGDDDSSEQYFKFVRNGNKYDISTSTEEMSIRMATEGWKNWTLDVNSNNHLQLTCQDRVTLKVKLQAHKDVCYNLFLLTDYNFPRRFCYPDDNNMCVRTNTIPPKTTTTTTPETTTTTTSPETTTTTTSPETTTTTTSPETTTTITSFETTTTTTSSETTSTTKAAIPAWPFTTATTSETIESEYTTTSMEIVVKEVSSAKGLPDAAGPALLLAFVMLLA